MSKPWVEKYRPRALQDICSQEAVVNALQECISTPTKAAALPHLLFHGPAGTGKTTTALSLARQLFGHNPETLSVRVRELNASDDRGIAVIREKVKRFVQNAVGNCASRNQRSLVFSKSGSTGPGLSSDTLTNEAPLPPFKLVILDEADALLPDAQAALRRMMEDYAASTRFILMCNYLSRIIDPITSRCVKYRFRSLPKEAVLERLGHICISEGYDISSAQEITDDTTAQRKASDETGNFFELLFESSGGDMRNAITQLQSVVEYSKPKTTTKEVSNGSVLRLPTTSELCAVLNIIPDEILLGYMYRGLFSRNFDDLQRETKILLQQGYGASQVLYHLLPFFSGARDTGSCSKNFMETDDVCFQTLCSLSNVQRARICEKFADVDKRLMDGGGRNYSTAGCWVCNSSNCRKEVIVPIFRTFLKEFCVTSCFLLGPLLR